MKKEYLVPEPVTKSETYFAKDSQWLIHKTPLYGFAIKSGHNAEPHNHNDVGAFILAANGRQAVTDLGSGPYSKQYFDKSTRYNTLYCSSRSHSVPIINGCYQHEGAEFAACDTVFENGVFSSNIAGAYPIPELKKLVRTVSFDKDAVNLKDSFDYDGDGTLVERISVTEEPVIKGDGEIYIGNGVTIRFDASAIRSLDILSEPAKAGRIVYFIDFTLAEEVIGIEFKFSVKEVK